MTTQLPKSALTSALLTSSTLSKAATFNANSLVQSSVLRSVQVHLSALESIKKSWAVPTYNLPDVSKLLRSIDVSGIVKLQQNYFNQLQPALNAVAAMQASLPKTNFDFLKSIDWGALSRTPVIPENWGEDYMSDLPKLAEIVNDEGIPLAWVPRASILRLLLDASTAEERVAIMLEREDEILSDCIEQVSQIDDEFLEPLMPTAHEVLDSCRDGRWRVGAISAVVLTHATVQNLHWVSDHQRARKHHRLTMNDPIRDLTEKATRAPLILFYDDWDPKSGKPRPKHISRHVVTHHFSPEQVERRNCLVAIMLMSSLMATVARLCLGELEDVA